MCAAVCGPPKCQCAPGYTRMNSACVLPYQCPSTPVSQPNPTCGQNEFYAACSSLCEPTCGNSGIACSSACGYPKCQCNPGMVRTGTQCVPSSTCPQAGPAPGPEMGPAPGPEMGNCAGQYEEWKQCASYCEPKCGESVPTTCNKACAPSSCQCKNGYQRQGTQCVPASQCQGGSVCPQDTCTLYCAQGRVKDSNGCSLCQCITSQTDSCTPNPCPIMQACVPLSFNCYTIPCQKYTCVGKTGGKPPGSPCVSSTECQSFHICYMGPHATMGLCLPGSG